MSEFMQSYKAALMTIVLLYSYYGAEVVEEKTDGKCMTFYFTVPESSELVDVNGKEMSGAYLADKIKKCFDVLQALGSGLYTYKIKFKVVEDDWDNESAVLSSAIVFESLYGRLW